jgi:hypothetical protein
MKEYKREKQHLEQRLDDVEKRAEDADERLIVIDTWLQQVRPFEPYPSRSSIIGI